MSVRVQWNTAAEMAAYHRGLSEEVKDGLARMPDSSNMTELIQKVHAIDNRLYERRQERKLYNLGGYRKRKESVSVTNSKPRKS